MRRLRYNSVFILQLQAVQFQFLSQSHQRSGCRYSELFCVSSQTNRKTTFPWLHYESIQNDSSGAALVCFWTYVKTNTNPNCWLNSSGRLSRHYDKIFGKCWRFLEQVGEAALLPLATFQPRTGPSLFSTSTWARLSVSCIEEQTHTHTHKITPKVEYYFLKPQVRPRRLFPFENLSSLRSPTNS